MDKVGENARRAADRRGSLIIGPVMALRRNGHYERWNSSRVPLAARFEPTGQCVETSCRLCSLDMA
jgi:hypothetical protein